MNQSMHFEILVHPQCIQRCRIKTREEHIYNNQQIHFPVLYSHRQIFVVVLKLVRRGIKVRIECNIVILNCTIEKVTGSLVQGIGIKAFLLQDIFRILFICRITENRCYRKLAVVFGYLLFELCIILHCHRNGANSKYRIEAGHTFPL